MDGSCCRAPQVTTRGETILVPLSPQDASYAIDAAAKEMYARLFQWAVRRVNYGLRIFASTGAPAPPDNAGGPTVGGIIGLLDMFGFESFEKNGLEQVRRGGGLMGQPTGSWKW